MDVADGVAVYGFADASVQSIAGETGGLLSCGDVGDSGELASGVSGVGVGAVADEVACGVVLQGAAIVGGGGFYVFVPSSKVKQRASRRKGRKQNR